LLGTLYPLFLDALNLGKISVGPPYFEAVFVPLMIPLLLLTAVGPFLAWKNDSIQAVLGRLRWLALGAAVVAALALLVFKTSVMVAVGVTLALWILFATLSQVVQRLAHAPAGASLLKRISRQPRSYWGMVIAHAGIGIFVVGVTLIKGMESAQDASLHVGQSVTLGDYEFTFSALKKIQGPNYIAARGTFEVRRGADSITTLHPEKRFYTVQKMPMTEAAIDRGFTRDLYVSIGEAAPDGAWLVRVQHKPFVSWIWAGCLAIALGGALAASDRRYRMVARQRAAASPPISSPVHSFV